MRGLEGSILRAMIFPRPSTATALQVVLPASMPMAAAALTRTTP
jgi:hypothetical protein